MKKLILIFVMILLVLPMFSLAEPVTTGTVSITILTTEEIDSNVNSKDGKLVAIFELVSSPYNYLVRLFK